VPIPVNDPAYWRKRAEEARVHAEQITDPESKKMMLKIAEDLRDTPLEIEEVKAKYPKWTSVSAFGQTGH